MIEFYLGSTLVCKTHKLTKMEFSMEISTLVCKIYKAYKIGNFQRVMYLIQPGGTSTTPTIFHGDDADILARVIQKCWAAVHAYQQRVTMDGEYAGNEEKHLTRSLLY